MTNAVESTTWIGWNQELDNLACRVTRHFGRVETRDHGWRYVLGLLSRTERKNSWQLAEIMHEDGPQGMQRLLNAAQWDVEAVRDELRAYVVEHLGEPDGLLVIDETGFLKKGSQSVGVARQYSGTAGRIENQQIGVFLAYASARGYAFLDRALYLPEEWVDDQDHNQQRRRAACVPNTVTFATKPALARHLLARTVAAQVPARWVVADTVYSTDDLRLWIETQDLWYVLAVPCTYSLWAQGVQAEAANVVEQLPRDAWVRLSAGDGCQGSRIYDWAWIRLPYRSNRGNSNRGDDAVGTDGFGGGVGATGTAKSEIVHWLIARRKVSEPHEYAYYHACAPADTSLAELVRVAGTRWVIEAGFAQAKGEVGLDHYQVRKWCAWYRHITLALLAYAYLAVLRAQAAQTAPPSENAVPLVPLTVPEVRRLIHTLTYSDYERRHQLRWSLWRRQHQAVAQRCHIGRRQKVMPPPLSFPTASSRTYSLSGIGALTDERWACIAPIFKQRQSRVGRPSIEHRHLLEAMLWVMHMGVSWREMPAAFGPSLADGLYPLPEMGQSWHLVSNRPHPWSGVRKQNVRSWC